MLLTRSTQYALQALVLLANAPNGQRIMARDLADRLHVPAAYLSKLMLRFAHEGILQSVRGPQGGYRLMRDPGSLTLRDVIVLVRSEHALQECFLGLKKCSDETACVMHSRWQPVKEKLLALLDGQSVGDLAAAVRSKRCRLEDLNLTRLPSAD